MAKVKRSVQLYLTESRCKQLDELMKHRKLTLFLSIAVDEYLKTGKGQRDFALFTGQDEPSTKKRARSNANVTVPRGKQTLGKDEGVTRSPVASTSGMVGSGDDQGQGGQHHVGNGMSKFFKKPNGRVTS